MKYLACLMTLVFLSAGCGSEAYITSGEAMTAVRNFEGNQLISFQQPSFEQLVYPDFGDCSVWRLQPESSDNEYCVNATTGEVCGSIYVDRYPLDEYNQPFREADSRTAALAFARSKYAAFDSMEFVVGTSEWLGTNWSFTWKQFAQYGAETYNQIDVEVNPEDLQILSYTSKRFVMGTIIQPQVSSQDALGTARTAAGIVTQTSVFGPTLLAIPSGSTRWYVEVGGENADGKLLKSYVTVDAVNGEVLDIEYALIRPLDKSKTKARTNTADQMNGAGAKAQHNPGGKTTDSRLSITTRTELKGTAIKSILPKKPVVAGNSRKKAATKSSAVKTNKKVQKKL